MLYSAYVHARPNTVDAHGIFYVGKGRDKRARKLARRNPHHQNIINKYGKENILVGKIECSSEDIAFELEKGLIKCLKRMGVKLTNLTDGGEGTSGYTRETTDDHRRKLSEANTGKRFSDERKRNIGQARLIHPMSPEAKERQRLSVSRPLTEEHKLKVSISLKASLSSSEARVKVGDKVRGKVWINNGVVTTRVQPEELEQRLASGWKRGRT